jgi:hypothetical protein
MINYGEKAVKLGMRRQFEFYAKQQDILLHLAPAALSDLDILTFSWRATTTIATKPPSADVVRHNHRTPDRR